MLWLALKRLPTTDDSWAWFPFVASIALFALSFFGLAYSFCPYVALEQLTIYEASLASESLFIILVGTCVVLPMIGGCTALAYTVFRRKARKLRNN